MVSKKHTPRAPSKVSSTKSLSASSSAKASTVIRAAFTPSLFQLSLFASVIQGLDGQQLQIHDTQTHKLLCQHHVPRARITALDWGLRSPSNLQSRDGKPKKRKRIGEESRNDASSESEQIVIGFGTDQSGISFYSPTTSRITSSLERRHSLGIKQFQFEDYGRGSRAWSLGGDESLVQWDLQEETTLRTIDLPLSPPSTLCLMSRYILAASHDTYVVYADQADQIQKLSHGTNTIHTLIGRETSDDAEDAISYLAISESNRQVLIYEHRGSSTQIGTLNAGAVVVNAALSGSSKKCQALAVLNQDNEVEIFANPFDVIGDTGVSGPKMKASKRAQTPIASVRICTLNESSPSPIAGISFDNDELIIAYHQKTGGLAFDRVSWRQHGTANPIALEGQIVRRKEPVLLGIHNAKETDREDGKQTKVDETFTIVAHDSEMNVDSVDAMQPDPITISSGEDDSDSDESTDEISAHQLPNGVNDATPQSTSSPIQQSKQNEDYDNDAMAIEEPSFGELIRANAPEVIDVTATSGTQREKGVVPFNKPDGKMTSGMSLGTVLAQALRANDKTLLESCLQEQDLHNVRATIERLDSSLAVALLQKLAEKLHSRPGRSGGLMVWVQWTLVSHGGYLASQPDLARKLGSLQRVIKTRADSLQPLLSLKGKLDMLEAQMNLRRSMQNRSAMTTAADEEAEEAAVYVEGQNESDSDAAGSDSGSSVASSDGDEDEDEDEGEVGIGSDVDDDSDEDEREGLVDDEASEALGSDEDDFEEEVDYEDADSIDEASEEDAPKSKNKGVSALPNGVRKA